MQASKEGEVLGNGRGLTLLHVTSSEKEQDGEQDLQTPVCI